MAVPLADSGDKAGGGRILAEARRLAEGLVAAGRGGDEARALLAKSLNDAIVSMPDPRDELEQARRAQAICEELVEKYPGVTRYLEELASSHITIGYVFYRLGRPTEVIAANADATAIYQRLVDAQPDVYRSGTRWRSSSTTSRRVSLTWAGLTRRSRRSAGPWRSGGRRPRPTPPSHPWGTT